MSAQETGTRHIRFDVGVGLILVTALNAVTVKSGCVGKLDEPKPIGRCQDWRLRVIATTTTEKKIDREFRETRRRRKRMSVCKAEARRTNFSFIKNRLKERLLICNYYPNWNWNDATARVDLSYLRVSVAPFRHNEPKHTADSQKIIFTSISSVLHAMESMAPTTFTVCWTSHRMHVWLCCSNFRFKFVIIVQILWTNILLCADNRRTYAISILVNIYECEERERGARNKLCIAFVFYQFYFCFHSRVYGFKFTIFEHFLSARIARCELKYGNGENWDNYSHSHANANRQ